MTDTDIHIYFTKMQFITYFVYKPEYAIILDIPQHEMAIIKYSIVTGDVIDSECIVLSDHEMEQILPLCNALECFASTFWTKLQNIFGHCCMSKLDKVAKRWPVMIRPAI